MSASMSGAAVLRQAKGAFPYSRILGVAHVCVIHPFPEYVVALYWSVMTPVGFPQSSICFRMSDRTQHISRLYGIEAHSCGVLLW